MNCISKMIAACTKWLCTLAIFIQLVHAWFLEEVCIYVCALPDGTNS